MFRTNPREYRVFFVIVTLVVALLVASPALQELLVYPRTEFFSELWLLGPNHKAEDYPYNITQDQNYIVYLGIGNQLGYCAYYQVEVKFRNQSQSAPSSFGPIANRTPSNLQSLYNISVVMADQSVWEKPLVFSFAYASDSYSTAVRVSSMVLNEVMLDLSGFSASWNSTRDGFLGNLMFELWLYDASSNFFQYHGRFVALWLNMTIV